MSILSPGRRITSRRLSQAGFHETNSRMQWPSPDTLRRASISLEGRRRASISLKGRRRALDIYDAKDVLISHEQMKKANQSTGLGIFGWVSNRNVDSLEED